MVVVYQGCITEQLCSSLYTRDSLKTLTSLTLRMLLLLLLLLLWSR
jgi:hypothetical protein